MKVSVNCDFKPIELTIKIETPEELNELYARVNAPTKNVEEHRLIEDLDLEYSNISPLWKAIRTACKKCFGKD